MLSDTLVSFYERDLRKLIEEITLFRNEENLWRTRGSIKNPAGNLALHIIGGTNYLIGTNLGNTGYVRDRDQEFIRNGVPRQELVTQLENLIVMITKTVSPLTQEQLDADYPMLFDGVKRSTSYILQQLLLHLNYHLGQINYLRRVLE
jgi:hypothetical protein